jgi:hypothetical protein
MPARVALSLVPLVTLSLLAFVPSVVLAARRRHRGDVVGAVAIGLTELAMLVCLTLAGQASREPADTLGACLLVVLLFGTPVHFLVMDQRAVWARLRPEQAPAPGYPQPYPAQPQPAHPYPAYGQPAYGQPVPQPPVAQPYPMDRPPAAQPPAAQPFAPQPPAAQPPVVQQSPPAVRQPPAAPPPAATSELQELGELLRRQAGGDGR